MTRDELLALGLSEEQAQAVLAEAEQTEVEIAGLRAQVAELTALLEERDRRDEALALLPQYQPRDAQLVLQLIDLNNIEDGGLEAQVEALKKRAPYLFAGEPDPAGGTAASGMNASEFDMNAFLRGEN